MAEPEKAKKDGVLSIDELISIAKDIAQIHRSTLEKQAWYEYLQREAAEQKAKLKETEAEHFDAKKVPIRVNTELWKQMNMQDIQEKLEEIQRQLSEAKKAYSEAQKCEKEYLDNYEKCTEVFAQAADAEDLVAMGQELKRLNQEAREWSDSYEYTCRNVEELQTKHSRIEAEDYSKKTGAAAVNPEMWKRMELMEIEENLEAAYERLPQMKTSAEDTQYIAGLFRKTFAESLDRFVRDDKERLEKLRNDYIKDEMQDTLRKQREFMMEYNWSFEERENRPALQKGLVPHVNKLLDSRDSRHGSVEWDRMCDALSALNIKETLDQMWDPTEPLNYDKEEMRKLREQINEAIHQTSAYVDKKKDSILVKLGIGKGPGYLRDARESLRALKHIERCIDTIDKEHRRLVKEADRRYKPELVMQSDDIEWKSASVKRSRSFDMGRQPMQEGRKSTPAASRQSVR